jgi:hypothetical protein
VFRTDLLKAFNATEFNSLFDRINGTGWVEGGAVSRGDGNFEIDIDTVDVFLDGRLRQVAPATRDLTEYYERANTAAKPLKVLVCVDQQGKIAIEASEPAAFDPPLDDSEVEGNPFNTNAPSPPDFSETTTPPVILAEVAILEDAEQLRGSDQIDDRRVPAWATLYQLRAHRVEARKRFIDPSGKAITSAIATENDLPTDAEIQAAAESATFSGSHNDLTDIGAADHHGGPGTQPFIDAVQAEDAADLASTSATTGDILYDDGWGEPPAFESPTVAQSSDSSHSQITHTGGSSTVATITGVTTDEFSAIIFVPWVASDPSWNADYGYTYDVDLNWDNTNTEVDIDITFTWKTDPGSGNDLAFSWAVYDLYPQAVDGRFTSDDALRAVEGSSIEPSDINPSQSTSIPVYDDLANYPSQPLREGSEARASGANTNFPAGKYSYTGNQWDGPFGEGVSTLGGLTVTSNRSMTADGTAYTFTDLAAPANPADAARQQEVSGVSDDVTAVSQDLTGHKQSSTAHGQTIRRTSRERAVRSLSLDDSGGVSAGDGATIAFYPELDNGDVFAIFALSVSESNGTVLQSGIITTFALFDGSGGSTSLDNTNPSSRTHILNSDPDTPAPEESLPETPSATSLGDILHYENTSGSQQRVGVVVDNGDITPGGTGADESISTHGYAEILPGGTV